MTKESHPVILGKVPFFKKILKNKIFEKVNV